MEGRLGKFATATALLSLPMAGALSACDNNSEVSHAITTNTASAITTPDIVIQSTRQHLKDAAKAKGLGIIFVDIIGYKPSLDIEIMLTRVDTNGGNYNTDLDNQRVKVGSTTSVLGASSCNGDYQLSLSLDNGNTFKPIANGTTPDQPLTSTFKLDGDCSSELALLFAALPSQNIQ